MDLLNVIIKADTSGADRSIAALDKMTAGARQADAAIASLGSRSAGGMTKVAQAADLAAAANRRLAASTQGASLSTANLAAQFQDIAVTSAMGMSPLQIALQQGTQISAAFGDKGAAGALKAIGGAFLSVISPVSLVTIGFVALAAIGLQTVDWTSLAKAALEGLAYGLEVIAPYAAVAAAGLALFYSPAIIMGIVNVIAMLGSLAAQAIMTGAAMLAANPVGAIVLGLAAAATALVIFRDEIAQVLGFDLVGVVQQGANYLIGAFVGAFNGIKAVWSKLPAAIGDLVILGVNATIGAVEGMLNSIIGKMNNFMNDVRMKAYEMGFPLKDGAGSAMAPVVFDRIQNPYAGAAADVAGTAQQAMSDAMSFDYVGGAIEFVQGAASGAADALRGLAGGMGGAAEGSDKAAKAAQKQADAYADLTRGAHEFIAAEELKARSLGMTEEAAARMKFTQDLLNKAANDNIDLTAGQRQELEMLGAAMAAAQEATRQITEIYDFGKGVFNGFFSDLKSGISEGKGLWESFANAASNALDTIASKMIEHAANGLWDMLFGAVMGSVTGGMGGGWGVAGGFGRPGIFGIPGMAEGGTVGRAGLSWVGERGPELLRLPAGAQIVPNGRSMSLAANQNQSNDNRPVSITVSVVGARGNAEIQQMVAAGVSQGMKSYDKQLPGRISEIQMRQG